MAPPVIRIGLIGHGIVGAAVAEQLRAPREAAAHRLGAQLVLAQVAVRDTARHRPRLAWTRCHDDPMALAGDERIDIVVEASGSPRADRWLGAALDRGATVVTANKQAIARSPRLLGALAMGEPRLFCEGAVAAAVPIVRALRESLEGEEILSLRGVLNGTTTFVLSRIEQGLSLDAALAEARSAGFAEADATDDLSGADAAAKLAILSTIAWRVPVPASAVEVRPLVVANVARLAAEGRRLRVVATATRAGDRTTAIVAPELLRPDDALFASSGVHTVVQVRSTLAGTLTWSGAGAGGTATASAVLADTRAAVRAILARGTRREAA